mmetsp:Transcript_9858/g.26834  ORF Transcript_9858/g.26834 Transcript_9858/m.26834 type:complete len:204 (+) Transcript_9858:1139-1750(+)
MPSSSRVSRVCIASISTTFTNSMQGISSWKEICASTTEVLAGIFRASERYLMAQQMMSSLRDADAVEINTIGSIEDMKNALSATIPDTRAVGVPAPAVPTAVAEAATADAAVDASTASGSAVARGQNPALDAQCKPRDARPSSHSLRAQAPLCPPNPLPPTPLSSPRLGAARPGRAHRPTMSAPSLLRGAKIRVSRRYDPFLI